MVSPSGASVSVLIFYHSWIWVSQSSSVWKDGSQNHTVIVGKGSNTQKCWKTKELRIHSRQFNCSGQTRDSWTTITKLINTAEDHSENNTVLRTQGGENFWTGSFFIIPTIIFSCWLWTSFMCNILFRSVLNKQCVCRRCTSARTRVTVRTDAKYRPAPKPSPPGTGSRATCARTRARNPTNAPRTCATKPSKPPETCRNTCARTPVRTRYRDVSWFHRYYLNWAGRSHNWIQRWTAFN